MRRLANISSDAKTIVVIDANGQVKQRPLMRNPVIPINDGDTVHIDRAAPVLQETPAAVLQTSDDGIEWVTSEVLVWSDRASALVRTVEAVEVEAPAVPFEDFFLDEPSYSITGQGDGNDTLVVFGPDAVESAPSGVRTVKLASPSLPEDPFLIELLGFDPSATSFKYNAGKMDFAAASGADVYTLLVIEWGSDEHPLGSITALGQNSIRIFFTFADLRSRNYTFTAVDRNGNTSAFVVARDTTGWEDVSSDRYIDFGFDNFVGDADLADLATLSMALGIPMSDDFSLVAIGTNNTEIEGYTSAD